MRAKLVAGAEEYGWIQSGKSYPVIGIYSNKGAIKFRILGEEEGVPALHDSKNIEILDHRVPQGWVFKIISPDIWEMEPNEWSVSDFWPRFFDGDQDAVSLFNSVVEKQ